MSDTYNYAAGAVHHDHHRSITINGASTGDLQALLKAFMYDEVVEVGEEVTTVVATPHMPEELLTDAARTLHAKLMEADIVDAEWQPVGLSFSEKGTLIDYVAERLEIRAKWKFFGALWHTDSETLRTSKARGLDQDKTWAFRSRLDTLSV